MQTPKLWFQSVVNKNKATDFWPYGGSVLNDIVEMVVSGQNRKLWELLYFKYSSYLNHKQLSYSWQKMRLEVEFCKHDILNSGLSI